MWLFLLSDVSIYPYAYEAEHLLEADLLAVDGEGDQVELHT